MSPAKSKAYRAALKIIADGIREKGGKKLKFVFEDVKDSNSVAVNAYLKVVRDIDPPLIFLSSYTTQNLATELGAAAIAVQFDAALERSDVFGSGG